MQGRTGIPKPVSAIPMRSVTVMLPGDSDAKSSTSLVPARPGYLARHCASRGVDRETVWRRAAADVTVADFAALLVVAAVAGVEWGTPPHQVSRRTESLLLALASFFVMQLCRMLRLRCGVPSCAGPKLVGYHALRILIAVAVTLVATNEQIRDPAQTDVGDAAWAALGVDLVATAVLDGVRGVRLGRRQGDFAFATEQGRRDRLMADTSAEVD